MPLCMSLLVSKPSSSTKGLVLRLCGALCWGLKAVPPSISLSCAVKWPVLPGAHALQRQ